MIVVAIFIFLTLLILYWINDFIKRRKRKRKTKAFLNSRSGNTNGLTDKGITISEPNSRTVDPDAGGGK